MKQFSQILTAAGMPADKVAELEALPAELPADWKPDDYLDILNSGLTTKLLADPKTYEGLTADKLPEPVRKGFESAQYGRFMNELADVATKELGLKEGEDFTKEDAAKLKSFAKIMATKFAGKAAGPADVKKLQEDLVQAIKEKNDTDTNWQTKHTTELEAAKGLGAQRLEKFVAISKVSSIPNLIGKPGIVADGLITALKSQYTVTMNPDTMEFSIKQKAHPTLDVVGSDGKVVSFDAALLKIATDNGLVGKGDDLDADGKKKVGKVEVDGDTAIPAYIKEKMDK